MVKEQKNTMLEELKESMLALTHQIQIINTEIDITKRTELKSTSTKMKIYYLSH